MEDFYSKGDFGMKQPETPEELAAFVDWQRREVVLPQDRAAKIAEMTAQITDIENGSIPDGFAGLVRAIGEAETVQGRHAGPLDLEMKRIKALFGSHKGDAEDLITYAKEIVGIRTKLKEGN
jgi:hypothetical protein